MTHPPFFSWAVDQLLAVGAFPFHHTHLQYLWNKGIYTVVTVSPERMPPMHTSPYLKWEQLLVPEGMAPSVEQISQFIALVEQNKARGEALCVHDANGKGRVGTLVACYLMKAWSIPADNAIEFMTRMRPGSIETRAHEERIHQYSTLLRPFAAEENSRAPSRQVFSQCSTKPKSVRFAVATEQCS